MIKAVISFILLIICSLLVALCAVYFKNVKYKEEIKQISFDLAQERDTSTALQEHLEEVGQSNKTLIIQLKNEREAMKAYQIKSDALQADLRNRSEKIRILENENEDYRMWASNNIPLGVIGLLNEHN